MNTIQPQITGRAAYSIAEVLAQTGLGRDKLYQLINSQQLPARKCGRRTIILADDLRRFLEALPTIGAGRVNQPSTNNSKPAVGKKMPATSANSCRRKECPDEEFITALDERAQ